MPAGLRAPTDARRTLLALLALLVIAVSVSAMLTVWSMARRSGEATVTITSAVFQPGGGTKDRQVQGYHLAYVFAVDGTTVPGVAFRAWVDVASRQPKVCYDPSDPRDHLLVEGSFPCGTPTFPMF